MKIHFTFKHLDHSEALMEATRQRLEEAARFLLKDGFAHVYFSKRQHLFITEISLNTREKYFRATGEGPDAYKSAADAVQILERQMKKLRKIVKNHHRPELSRKGRLEMMNDRMELKVALKKAA
ncbi:MAG: HPF/RaiA family ribosome-associated protein [Bdellovibrionaceae bacterium]|nr:HPF/RaiA family ribosome-associated protein [Pseudobdellovibrionaceae bacterium]